jgi:transcription elongation factor GreA-like protein
MKCKVRSFQLLPDVKNTAHLIKSNQDMNHLIYDEDMFFPIKYQKDVSEAIQIVIRAFPHKEDQEKAMNEIIEFMKGKYGLTTYKPMFPKENLGVLIGDPYFKYY